MHAHVSSADRPQHVHKSSVLAPGWIFIPVGVGTYDFSDSYQKLKHVEAAELADLPVGL